VTRTPDPIITKARAGRGSSDVVQGLDADPGRAAAATPTTTQTQQRSISGAILAKVLQLSLRERSDLLRTHISTYLGRSGRSAEAEFADKDDTSHGTLAGASFSAYQSYARPVRCRRRTSNAPLAFASATSTACRSAESVSSLRSVKVRTADRTASDPRASRTKW
jgi:hypothetical protein